MTERSRAASASTWSSKSSNSDQLIADPLRPFRVPKAHGGRQVPRDTFLQIERLPRENVPGRPAGGRRGLPAALVNRHPKLSHFRHRKLSHSRLGLGPCFRSGSALAAPAVPLLAHGFRDWLRWLSSVIDAGGAVPALPLRPPRLRAEQSGSALLPQPVAVAADRHHVAVVQQAIEDRRRHHLIAEHLVRLLDRSVGADQHAALLIAAGDQLEK